MYNSHKEQEIPLLREAAGPFVQYILVKALRLHAVVVYSERSIVVDSRDVGGGIINPCNQARGGKQAFISTLRN